MRLSVGLDRSQYPAPSGLIPRRVTVVRNTPQRRAGQYNKPLRRGRWGGVGPVQERCSASSWQKKAQPVRVALKVPPKEEVLEEYVGWRRRKASISKLPAECKRLLLLRNIRPDPFRIFITLYLQIIYLYYLTISTGIFAWVNTLRVSLPSSTAARPLRPCEVMTMRSQLRASAALRMAS